MPVAAAALQLLCHSVVKFKGHKGFVVLELCDCDHWSYSVS